MTEQRSTTDPITEQVSEIVDRAEIVADVERGACRGARTRSTASCARSRTTSCGWARWSRSRSARPSRRSTTTTPTPRSRSSRATAASTRRSAHASTLIARTIATQQPVARDLRFLLTLDHVTYELERIGDHAASVAKQARKLAPEPPLKDYVDLPEMGELAAVARPRRSCGRSSTSTQDEAREVAARDDEIDDLYHATFAEVVDLMRADPANVERGTRILFAAHYLERIGDRVTNIAEDVVFLATGEVEDLNP